MNAFNCRLSFSPKSFTASYKSIIVGVKLAGAFFGRENKGEYQR